MNIHILEKQLEETRKRLNSMTKNTQDMGNNEELVKLSQELDLLINQYMSLCQKK